MARILIVDDDVDLVSLFLKVLQKKGHDVVAEHSANSGWKTLEKFKPELVILDCMMEEFTSGFTLSQSINHYYPTIPMIMLSSVKEHMRSDWTFSPEDKKWLPIHKFREKPVVIDSLMNDIDEILGKAGE